MADLLNINLSNLSTNKTSLTITDHNIVNVNTPDFSRQEAVQATRIPQFSGAGYIGSGTTLVDVRRIYNEFLNTQVRSSTALNSDTQAYLSQINQLDSLLAGSTTGVTPGLQRLFAALQTAAEDPANIPARQAGQGSGQFPCLRILRAELRRLRQLPAEQRSLRQGAERHRKPRTLRQGAAAGRLCHRPQLRAQDLADRPQDADLPDHRRRRWRHHEELRLNHG